LTATPPPKENPKTVIGCDIFSANNNGELNAHWGVDLGVMIQMVKDKNVELKVLQSIQIERNR
jgi:hypothetical protein